MRERELPDDYPVHLGYLYVADGKVINSDIEGTVRELKWLLKATIITSCDIIARNLWGRVV